MTNYEKYYIYQGYGKPSRIKARLLTKLGMNFRGLIILIIMKTVYGHNRDHYTRNHHYILDNTMWTKINSDMHRKLVIEHKLSYEHIDSDWIDEKEVLC